ncbi:transposase [Alteromonadaceae bacterium M269]|nr:transposase [Alteromonadaceae bacterium M269]
MSVHITQGAEVEFNRVKYRINKVINLTEVLLLDPESGELLTANVSDLKASDSRVNPSRDLVSVDQKLWQIAQERFSIIKPLLKMANRKRSDVESVAKEYQVGTNTIYRWIKAYEDSGLLTSLFPQSRSDRGGTKFTDEVETIVEEVVKAEYLSGQRKSQAKVCELVRKACKEANLTPPHNNTIRNRIKDLSGALVALKREGKKKYQNDFQPIKGAFPDANAPLMVVQIDHTKLDIILVDDIYRKPIGRPWITLAFDVFSRMVTGFYVSFDPPGALATGLCMAHSILSKDEWLVKHEVSGEWPVWGLPDKVHVDNAKEFRGYMLQKACDEYGIDLEWRPVARPHFGAHVERALGTFSKEIHTLPGTTFSNTQERGEYDSEKQAALSLSEFETWLANYVVDVYHQKKHSMIGMSPLEKYKQGILGTADFAGSGLKPKIEDEQKLRFDFMPFEIRSILDYGVQVDKVHYYHEVLRRWINAIDPEGGGKKRKFIFRRDPRDISVIYFFDPEVQEYYPIPYRDISHPPISIWELREINRRLSEEGYSKVDEQAIFDAYDRMKEIEEKAVIKSKAVRRAQQRKKDHRKASPNTSREKTIEPIISNSEDEELDILPFDDLDDDL